MKPLRCAVVGTGHGMAHVVQVLAHPRMELVAVCAATPVTLDYLRGAPVPDDLDSVTFTAPRAELIRRARSIRRWSARAWGPTSVPSWAWTAWTR